MSGEDGDTVASEREASQSLRQLARWILRDDIDSLHLQDYMRRLLSRELVELHASCRFAAMELAKGARMIEPLELAGRLDHLAGEWEHHPAIARPRNRHLEYSRRSVISSIHTPRLTWLPECVACISFITIAVVLIRGSGGDLHLRLLASFMCGIVGVTHAVMAIRAVRRNRRGSR